MLCDLHLVELDNFDGEVRDGYGGDRLLVWWIMMRKIPTKHVRFEYLNNVHINLY
jgi:hypothetical protein